jgi:hypothetical protein
MAIRDDATGRPPRWSIGQLGRRSEPETAAGAATGEGAGPIASLERALDADKQGIDRHAYRLLLRFAVINLVGFALLGAAYGQGWIETIIAADTSRLSIIIAVLFLAGFALAGYRVARISRELNQVRAFDPLFRSRVGQYLEAIKARSAGSRAITAEGLKLRLADRLGTVRHIANALVLLGLIGTVLGFIEALGGVSAETVGSAESITPMVAQLVEGMSVALYTTLVGSVLNLWLMANYRLLVSGTVSLATALIDLGERYARD